MDGKGVVSMADIGDDTVPLAREGCRPRGGLSRNNGVVGRREVEMRGVMSFEDREEAIVRKERELAT